MLLAIDAGNTNVVFAVYDGDVQRGVWRAATDSRRTADEYAVWLLQLMSKAGLDAAQLDGCIVASVVPLATFNLLKLVREHLQLEPLVIGEPNVQLGLRVLLDRPEEVGADRIVNAVAASERYGGPLIVIDFGTATTFDVVDANGDYRGGVIAPGIILSVEALHMAAAKLPKVDVVRPKTDNVIATSTVTAMQSGIYWGYVGLIEGLVARIRAELGGGARVIATGGLATLFADATQAIDSIDEDLTLRGLVLLYQRNAQSAAVAA
ncbi:type III pantothenate kinase [Roseiterribacter gracilis]|uniref:Type III pantothenate kinase n=1 Tax=Roseiterribacter gracilis TaxID=2812848 RepID=A0A8S8X6Y7_9PROT|nr:type III pantothenate kinase [Rhodospirillales bacterium TMPK1]